MATERHRPERRAAHTLPGDAGSVVRRLFLFGVFVVLGWCALALLSGANAAAAETTGSTAAPESSSLLGTGTLSDVLDEATSAVRSAGNHRFDLVTVQRGDPQPATSGTEAPRAGRTHGDETTPGADRPGDRSGDAGRSVLGLVSIPVRGMADPGAGVPVPLGTAVHAVDRTLGQVAGTPVGAVTHGLVTPIDHTVTRAATGLGAVHGVVPTGRVGVPAASPVAGRSTAPGATAGAPTRHVTAVRTAASASGTGTDGAPRAGLPSDGHDHTPSAPAADDAPAMPLGVAGGSASGSGSGNAGASGTYLDFAGVRPSAAFGPVWTVRHNDEQVPLDDQDRPRVSPD